MKILFIHNRYLQRGGEDAVLLAEYNLLKTNHEVRLLEFDNEGIRSTFGKVKMSVKGFYNPASARKLRNEIHSFQPDIIHVHNFFYIASPAVFYVADKHNIPIVQTLHNYRLICPAATLLRDNQICENCVSQTFPVQGIWHRCFKDSMLQSAHLGLITGIHKLLGTWREKVDKYIVLTEFTRQKLIHSSLNLPKEKVVVKPNFVDDMGDFSDHKRNGRFLFVGRLSKEKGIDTLVEAAKQVGIGLDIVGDGPLETQVQSLAAENMEITYYGRQNKDFVIDKMKSCEALVFPSIWYEGLPITILEAFSTGTPVIASDIDNVNTIVTDGFNGLHFQYGDAGALAAKLKAFSNNPNRNLYKNARKTFELYYSTTANYHQIIDIYTETIAAKKAASGIKSLS